MTITLVLQLVVLRESTQCLSKLHRTKLQTQHSIKSSTTHQKIWSSKIFESSSGFEQSEAPHPEDLRLRDGSDGGQPLCDLTLSQARFKNDQEAHGGVRSLAAALWSD